MSALLFSYPLFKYNLFGTVVFIGTVTSSLVPDATYATKEEFKAVAITGTNYLLVVDKENYLPASDPFWSPFNTDSTFEFSIRWCSSCISVVAFEYNYEFSLG